MRYVATIALLLTACVSVNSDVPFALSYSAEDKPQDAKIYIGYSNQSKHDICIDPIHWPNSKGEIDTGRDRVFIDVSGKRYTIKDFNTGYCPGCAMKVRSGSTLSGFFRYSDFNLPIESYSKIKTLIFSPIGVYCRK